MGSPGVVVVLDQRSSFSEAVRSDLAQGEFDVVVVSQWKDMLSTVRERRPVAVVVPPNVTASSWRRFERESGLGGVRVVVAVPGKSRVPRPLPFFALVRADAYVNRADSRRAGAVSDAVRAAVARGPDAPAGRRESVGRALWYTGSAAYVVAPFFLLGGFAVAPAAGAKPPPGLINWFVVGYGAGVVLMDAGGRLARSLRLALRWDSWMWLVMLVAYLSLEALRWTGLVPRVARADRRARYGAY